MTTPIQSIATAIKDAFSGLIDERMREIDDIAGKAEDQTLSVSCSIKLDYTGPVPIGTLNISYADRKKASAPFFAKDPNQDDLPLDAERDAKKPTSITVSSATLDQIKRLGKKLREGGTTVEYIKPT